VIQPGTNGSNFGWVRPGETNVKSRPQAITPATNSTERVLVSKQHRTETSSAVLKTSWGVRGLVSKQHRTETSLAVLKMPSSMSVITDSGCPAR
jgi:hypothetical protein